jgi:hypothetical protein
MKKILVLIGLLVSLNVFADDGYGDSNNMNNGSNGAVEQPGNNDSNSQNSGQPAPDASQPSTPDSSTSTPDNGTDGNGGSTDDQSNDNQQ